MVTPYFLFGYNGTYKDLLSMDSFKPRKNNTVFESIKIGKPEYLEMRRKYAQ